MTEQDERPGSNTRRRIIEEAQLQCFQARSACIRARDAYGEVPRDYRRYFQETILDYYWALKPLKDEPPVDDWWDLVELSANWRTVMREAPQVSADGGEPATVGPERTDSKARTGLDTLKHLDEATEVITEAQQSYLGSWSAEIERPHVLPHAVLKDLSDRLDEAWGRLGGNPTTPTPIELDPEPI